MFIFYFYIFFTYILLFFLFIFSLNEYIFMLFLIMSFHSHFIVAVLFVCLFSCVASVSSVVETSVTSKADAHPVPQPCRQVLI